MRIDFNLFSQNTGILNVHRINQSVAGQKQGKEEVQTGRIRLDMVSISTQGQNNSLIDMLMKQKTTLKERMESLIHSAAEDGLSMDSIRSQLEEYEKQLKDIDVQIAEAMAKEAEKQAENMQEDRSKKTMTEEEFQQAKMADLMSMAGDLEQAEIIDSVKTRVDGESGVLEAEINLDKGRGGSVVEKEKALAALKQKSETLTEEIGEQAVEVSAKIRESNEVTVEDSQETESGRKYGLYQLDGSFVSQQDKLSEADEKIRSALALNGGFLSADNMLNETVTVEVKVKNSEKPQFPDRPPHHDRSYHQDKYAQAHPIDSHYRPPHGGKHDEAEETITLTFVKTLATPSVFHSENTLKINGENILLNANGEAPMVMSDRTIRYVKLTPELLEQLSQ